MEDVGGSTTVEVNVNEPAGAEAEVSQVLVVAHGPAGVQSLVVAEGQSRVVGRQLPADLIVNDASLSRLHAEIAFDGARVQVTDLGSRNGTRLGSARLQPRTATDLKLGQALKMGATRLLVHGLARHGLAGQSLMGEQGGAEARAPARQAQDGVVAVSSVMTNLLRQADKAARAPVSILIQGETGSGKEVVAGYVHRRSARAQKPLVTVNCGAIPESLLASTLFGHVRGAFTGAVQAQAGLFEQADGGTLFLDEVGELSLEAQVNLLRVLESGRITRVGGAKEVAVDVRIISATHRDLPSRVHSGLFREDLLYRLNAVALDIAPLRERIEDLESLSQVLLRAIAARFEMPVPRLAAPSLAALQGYAFPGNVRELRNVLEHGMVQCEQGVIGVADLPSRIRAVFPAIPALRSLAAGQPEIATPDVGATVPGRWLGLAGSQNVSPGAIVSDEGVPFRTRMERIEEGMIREALAATGGNQTEAAERLQIPRRTLVHKLRSYGLSGRS